MTDKEFREWMEEGHDALILAGGNYILNAGCTSVDDIVATVRTLVPPVSESLITKFHGNPGKYFEPLLSEIGIRVEVE